MDTSLETLDCSALADALSLRGERLLVAGPAWQALLAEAEAAVAAEPVLGQATSRFLTRHAGFADALAARLAAKLADADIGTECLAPILATAMEQNPDIAAAAAEDLIAVRDRDPACHDLLTPFLYFKGYHALQAHRFAHHLWGQGRIHLARFLQSRMSEVFTVDIHPAARLGRRIMIDHGTSVVIGETAVVDDDVSLLQEVTLGGTGKADGDRHPKIRRGVLIGAGAKVLGNIEVGEGAKIGAGSIVLHPVPAHTTVVGNPARPVGHTTGLPALTMDQMIPPG